MVQLKSSRLKKLVILTGSGISSESGIRTFREMGGLWEEYNVEDVASLQAWQKDMELVLRFYNERRKQLLTAHPNPGHYGLVALEDYFDVQIITQNVDDLHERAGSHKVLHLHGELRKARSTKDPGLIYDIDGWELKTGDKCEKGSQLRPHVVWFGESVPEMENAVRLTREADLFVIIGTSLVVYPAAGLLDFVPSTVPVYLIDPNDVIVPRYRNIVFIKEKASTGVIKLTKMLLEKETSGH
jgi:NAD-dependent deacetylase